MTEFESKSLCILGRQPALGLAELESLYGAEHIQPLLPGVALLDIEAGSINFKRLGGTIKVARLLSILPTTKWPVLLKYLVEKIPEHLKFVPSGAFTLGLSVYNLDISPQELNRSMMKLKKIIKKSGRSVRIVPNKELALNSAQVLHNKLTYKGGWELVFVGHGRQTILAQTMFVQDIEAYAARDQVRPKRDPRVGMLPPKLAQIMINLVNPSAGGIILDPFCGSGVILQEALLMGYQVVGSDIDPRMVEYAQTNLDWLANKFDIAKTKYSVEQADATNHKWPENIDAVVSEVYLGRPLTSLPSAGKLNEIIQDVNTITKKFLQDLARQLAPRAPLTLAVPAWRDGNRFIYLPAIDRLTDLGYNRVDFKHVRSTELVYFRPNQTVARQLLVLKKVYR